MKTAIIGDIGGHSHALRKLLEKQGVVFSRNNKPLGTHRPTGQEWATIDIQWPKELHVVSVGDVIHRGPDSEGVVCLIDLIAKQGCWTPVVGNHEQLYVDARIFEWDEELPAVTTNTIKKWWTDGVMVPGAIVQSDTGKPTLVTHGGLTHGFWKAALGSEQNPQNILQALGETKHGRTLWFPGMMLGNHSFYAGPVWAEAGMEVILSWAQEEADQSPVDQVHGHSSAYDWLRKTWRVPEQLQAIIETIPGKRHTHTIIGQSHIWGVDPCHLQRAAPVFAAHIIENSSVIV